LLFEFLVSLLFWLLAWLRPVIGGEKFLGHGGKQLMAAHVGDLGADFVFRARPRLFQTWRRVDPSDGEPSIDPDQKSHRRYLADVMGLG
jgi:hypothetical protein